MVYPESKLLLWSVYHRTGLTFPFFAFHSSSSTIPVGLNGFSPTSRSRCGSTALSLWSGYIFYLIIGVSSRPLLIFFANF